MVSSNNSSIRANEGFKARPGHCGEHRRKEEEEEERRSLRCSGVVVHLRDDGGLEMEKYR